jgi:hypothetical protein
MKIIGCDLHSRFQQIAMLDMETGAGSHGQRFSDRGLFSSAIPQWQSHVINLNRASRYRCLVQSKIVVTRTTPILPPLHQPFLHGAGWRRVKLCDIVSDTDESQCSAPAGLSGRRAEASELCGLAHTSAVWGLRCPR